MTDPLLWLHGDPTEGRRLRVPEPGAEREPPPPPDAPAPASAPPRRFGAAVAGGRRVPEAAGRRRRHLPRGAARGPRRPRCGARPRRSARAWPRSCDRGMKPGSTGLSGPDEAGASLGRAQPSTRQEERSMSSTKLKRTLALTLAGGSLAIGVPAALAASGGGDAAPAPAPAS